MDPLLSVLMDLSVGFVMVSIIEKMVLLVSMLMEIRNGISMVSFIEKMVLLVSMLMEVRNIGFLDPWCRFVCRKTCEDESISLMISIKQSFIVQGGIDDGIRFELEVGIGSEQQDIYLLNICSSSLCSNLQFGYIINPNGSVLHGSCIYYSHEKFQINNHYSSEILKGIANCVDRALKLKLFI